MSVYSGESNRCTRAAALGPFFVNSMQFFREEIAKIDSPYIVHV